MSREASWIFGFMHVWLAVMKPKPETLSCYVHREICFKYCYVFPQNFIKDKQSF